MNLSVVILTALENMQKQIVDVLDIGHFDTDCFIRTEYLIGLKTCAA